MPEDDLILPEGADAIITIERAMEIAMEMIGYQRLPYAAEILEKIIEVVPDHATAYNYLGILYFHLKGPQAAVDLLSHAVSVAPNYAAIRNNLGNAHAELGDIDAAEQCYRESIRLDPKLADPYGNLAAIMKNRGNNAEAEALLRQAVELNPKNGYGHHNLANMLIANNRAKEAIHHYWKAAALLPDKNSTSPALAIAYVNAGMIDEAKDFVRKWAKSEPDDPQAQHLRASITGEDIPSRAGDGYVKNLFDSFANSFDAKLDLLGYRAPTIVGEAVARFVGDVGPVFDIVDAGCGTGKCGKYLKPFAKSLVGVDLSGGMLEKARKLDLYDRLEEAELTGFLDREADTWDLVVSADTLCYFGALEEFAKASFKSLRPGGSLVFTVEHLNADRKEDYVLAFNGRYAHNEDYVKACLDRAGFSPVSIGHDDLRMENGSQVAGLVITARRSA